jgi:transposase
LRTSQVRDFSNDACGFRGLREWFKERRIVPVNICMEATNRYWEPLALFLYKQKYAVCVVNPSRTAAFWKSEQLRAKTDHIDAAMLARFCRAQKPYPWKPPTPQERQLRRLVRDLEFLKRERARFKIRLEFGGRNLQRVVKALSEEIRSVRAQAIKLIRLHSDMSTGYRNLQTIPGVGSVTALIMLAEVSDKVHRLHPNELVAYAGLAPRICESGSSIRKSKGTAAGNSTLKRAFYLPAVAAIRTSKSWKSFATRFAARGKPKKVAIGAATRKLFVIACGVLKTGTPYDPSRCPGLA